MASPRPWAAASGRAAGTRAAGLSALGGCRLGVWVLPLVFWEFGYVWVMDSGSGYCIARQAVAFVGRAPMQQSFVARAMTIFVFCVKVSGSDWCSARQAVAFFGRACVQQPFVAGDMLTFVFYVMVVADLASFVLAVGWQCSWGPSWARVLLAGPLLHEPDPCSAGWSGNWKEPKACVNNGPMLLNAFK
mmetsp:Transcript_45088/g.140135  ORF Transcript_45088/g.140135 Transcript_45088/m.140135 type:complete len:189 (+) Transcript_45088:126-692(+)